jgi:hypothetical protein
VSTYVTVSVHSRPEFPAVCPFTGAANPRKWVAVRKSRASWLLPIPFLGFIVARDVARFRLPASSFIVSVDKLLGRITLVCGLLIVFALIVLRIAGAFFAADQTGVPRAANRDEGGVSWLTIALVVIVANAVAQIWRRLNVRAVKIVELSPNGMEIRFRREDYAKEFCALNALTCHSEPSWERMAARKRQAA